jgi:short-subunit dehydrogenase
MNWKKRFNGKAALITGASSGLGAEFARQLADLGVKRLVLTARRTNKLEELQAELKDKVETIELVTGDLSTLAGAEAMWKAVLALGPAPDILINNAGFGVHGPHMDIPWEKEKTMLNVDVMSLAYLTKAFISERGTVKESYISLVASIGGYQPSPTYAAYSAAKSYVLNFGEALNYELRKTGVKVSVLSPGVTDTGFLDTSGQKPTLYQRMFMMKSPPVVKAGLKALSKGVPSRIPGFGNKFMTFTIRFAPRRLVTWLAHKLMTTG